MLKWKDFSIGGYNFNNLSDVIELYLPDDVTKNGPARTLHVRGREELEPHLQHYFIPYGRVFIGLRATVQLTTNNSIGLFGTHFRWRKGVTKPWAALTSEGAPNSYYIGNDVVRHGDPSKVYSCNAIHTVQADRDEPGVGAVWETYWNTHPEDYLEAWQDNHFYYRNEFVTREFVCNGLTIQSGYRAWIDHDSQAARDEPGEGTDWGTYWEIGDEMQSDLSWPYYYYPSDGSVPNQPGFVEAINLSEGHKFQFSRDVIGKFRGWHSWPETNHEGRALDALCTPGYMKQDGILWGVEVDDEEYYHQD